MAESASSPTTTWAGNGKWKFPSSGNDSGRETKTALGFSRGEGFLDELPHFLVAERLHPLLHASRPVGTSAASTSRSWDPGTTRPRGVRVLFPMYYREPFAIGQRD